MLKKETFNLEDSNVAGLGSDLDKKCRVDAAATEKAWSKAGKKPGLQIWRIEKFRVKASKTPPGTFYSDDSYICLNTYKVPETEKLAWDIHFWIGSTSSQDEYGTAAYKTVELDDFLGGGPVQHREVMDHESSLFLSYFKDTGGIRLLEGGVESGFNPVKPEEYKPRLLHLKGRKNIRVTEVPIKVESLNEGDVFILDCGLMIYQWQGKKAGKNEKARAGQLCRAIDDERRGKPEVEVFAQGDKDAGEFWKAFGLDAEPAEIPADSGDDAEWEKKSEKRLLHLSDASGKLEFKMVAETTVKKSQLISDDVFIFDIGSEVFVWVGKGASKEEKRQAMQYAQNYLKEYKRPAWLPISRILEGGENEVFNSSFDRE
jgi:gelsolin